MPWDNRAAEELVRGKHLGVKRRASKEQGCDVAMAKVASLALRNHAEV